MTTDEFKRDNPLGPWMESKGIELKRGTTNRCPIKDHKPGHLCVTVDVVKEVWHCNDHDKGGDIFRWMSIEQGKPDADIIKSLCGNGKAPSFPKTTTKPPPTEFDIKKIYSYQDANGNESFQVLRLEPKDFRQRHNVGGKWEWNMAGVTRVLYQLPKVLAAQQVLVCEGEKDADTVTALGFIGTTNVGGATNWLDGYSETLSGKDVVICRDNDEKGKAHVKVVLESIQKKAKTVKCLPIPEQFKDVTDWLGELPTDENKATLAALIESTPSLIQGLYIPIFSLAEAEKRFVENLKNQKQHELDLGKWLPSLSNFGCQMMPGEVATFIAQTGVGKTYVLQNVARIAAPLATVLFELELPESLLYERFMAIRMEWGTRQIREAYSGGELLGEEGLKQLAHCHICTESGITVETLSRHIENAELKTGHRPKVVLVDYIQIMQGNGTRRERISDIAEQIKILAKTSRVIIITASQTARKPNDVKEVFLTDAKESGSIENSSGLVFGMWPDEKDSKRLTLKILKNTKGEPGHSIACRFKPGWNGAFTGRIVEETPGDDPEYQTQSDP